MRSGRGDVINVGTRSAMTMVHSLDGAMLPTTSLPSAKGRFSNGATASSGLLGPALRASPTAAAAQNGSKPTRQTAVVQPSTAASFRSAAFSSKPTSTATGHGGANSSGIAAPAAALPSSGQEMTSGARRQTSLPQPTGSYHHHQIAVSGGTGNSHDVMASPTPMSSRNGSALNPFSCSIQRKQQMASLGHVIGSAMPVNPAAMDSVCRQSPTPTHSLQQQQQLQRIAPHQYGPDFSASAAVFQHQHPQQQYHHLQQQQSTVQNWISPSSPRSVQASGCPSTGNPALPYHVIGSPSSCAIPRSPKAASLPPDRCQSPMTVSPPDSSAGGAGHSSSTSFLARAAQRLKEPSRRRKHRASSAATSGSQPSSMFPTNFQSIIGGPVPPPVPVDLLRSSLTAAGGVATSALAGSRACSMVKVLVRICPSDGGHSTINVDARLNHVILFDPTSSTTSGVTPTTQRHIVPPKMFAFDAVFPSMRPLVEVCATGLVDIIPGVVDGFDGCLFSYGHARIGKTYTMLGVDQASSTLGVIPCAIHWLFALINDRKEKTGARFSVRVSAVEITGKHETLKDLLADVAPSTESVSPGVCLRDDPVCGTQLENQSELRAPTAERAAYYLDAAIAARTLPEAEDDARNSHLLFTIHVYQYRVEKTTQGENGVAGGRSRLHLLDLGSCSKSKDGTALSLSALGTVLLGLLNGQRHLPYRESKLTQLIKESLGGATSHACMIAHVSPSAHSYNETLQVLQLASRVCRMRGTRRRPSKWSGTSSEESSSCSGDSSARLRSGRVRLGVRMGMRSRRHHGSNGSGIDYTSSSEQSCDTVIYMGSDGRPISDRELTDCEGPPSASRYLIKEFRNERTAFSDPETCSVLSGQSGGRRISTNCRIPSASNGSLHRTSGHHHHHSHHHHRSRESQQIQWANSLRNESEMWIDGPPTSNVEQWVDGPPEFRLAAVPDNSCPKGGLPPGSNGVRDLPQSPMSRQRPNDASFGGCAAPVATTASPDIHFRRAAAGDIETENDPGAHYHPQQNGLDDVLGDECVSSPTPVLTRSEGQIGSGQFEIYPVHMATVVRLRCQDEPGTSPTSPADVVLPNVDARPDGKDIYRVDSVTEEVVYPTPCIITNCRPFEIGRRQVFDTLVECDEEEEKEENEADTDSDTSSSRPRSRRSKMKLDIDALLLAGTRESVYELRFDEELETGSRESLQQLVLASDDDWSAWGTCQRSAKNREVELDDDLAALDVNNVTIPDVPPSSTDGGLGVVLDCRLSVNKTGDSRVGIDGECKNELLSNVKAESPVKTISALPPDDPDEKLVITLSENGKMSSAISAEKPEIEQTIIESVSSESDLTSPSTPSIKAERMSSSETSDAGNVEMSSSSSMSPVSVPSFSSFLKKPSASRTSVIPKHVSPTPPTTSPSTPKSGQKPPPPPIPVRTSSVPSEPSTPSKTADQTRVQSPTTSLPTAISKPTQRQSKSTSSTPTTTTSGSKNGLASRSIFSKDCSVRSTESSSTKELRSKQSEQLITPAPAVKSKPSGSSKSCIAKFTFHRSSSSSSSNPTKSNLSNKQESSVSTPVITQQTTGSSVASKFKSKIALSTGKKKEKKSAAVGDSNSGGGVIATAVSMPISPPVSTDKTASDEPTKHPAVTTTTTTEVASSPCHSVDSPRPSLTTAALVSPYHLVTSPRAPISRRPGSQCSSSDISSSVTSAACNGDAGRVSGRTRRDTHEASSGYESMMTRDSEEMTSNQESSGECPQSEATSSIAAKLKGNRTFRKKAKGRSRSAPARGGWQSSPDTINCLRGRPWAAAFRDWPMGGGTAHDDEIQLKVYDVDDAAKMARWRQQEMEACLLEDRRKKIQELLEKQEKLKLELSEAKSLLMVNPSSWSFDLHVAENHINDNPDYLAALETETAILEKRVRACRSRIMVVTCFDVTSA